LQEVVNINYKFQFRNHAIHFQNVTNLCKTDENCPFWSALSEVRVPAGPLSFPVGLP
jgi:hypothetical protein